MKRILWLSVSPFVPTGYGTQTAQATRRIHDSGRKVAISCHYGVQYMEIDWDGIKIYPADHTGLNKKVLRAHVEDFGEGEPVQVISLYDIWAWVDMHKSYGACVADYKGLDIAAWLPVDTLGITPKTRLALDEYQARPIAMSRFGEDQLREAGYDPLYAPHGIDTAVYAPVEDRAACKKMLNVPEDAFLVGMVANNSGTSPPRKAFCEVLMAFKHFRDAHPDAYLYLHTEATGIYDGLNLLGHAAQFGVSEDSLRFVRQSDYLRGLIKPEYMAGIYSAFDVLANPSYGEGFGLPIVEAQACGTPVITSSWTSMPELTGAGWCVGGQPWYNPASGGVWLHPAVEEILAAFEAAYEQRENLEIRRTAREFALNYDADKVFAEHWLPILEELDRPREVPPLNRAARRAKKKVAA